MESREKLRLVRRWFVTNMSVWIIFVVCTVTIAFLNYLMTDDVKLGKMTWILVSSLQAVGSTLIGYYLFPRIFGNDQLKTYQKSVAKNTFNVLSSSNGDAAKILIMNGMQDNLSDMPQELVRQVIEEQESLRNVLKGGFSANDREKVITQLTDIYERVLNIKREPDYRVSAPPDAESEHAEVGLELKVSERLVKEVKGRIAGPA
jgi:hypothetical protein